MQQDTRGALPAASGYASLSAALSKPTYADGFLKKYKHVTVSGQISKMEDPKKLLKEGGDEVIFRRAPEAVIHDYQLNQELEVDTVSTSTVSMFVKRAVYSNIKIDLVEKMKTPELAQFMTEFNNDVMTKLAQKIDSEMLLEVPRAAAACNRGRNAGARSHQFNLGTAGAPVILTAQNIVNKLAELRVVLSEGNVDTNGLYVVLPTEAMALFYANPILSNACASGMNQSIILGAKIPNVMGFEVIFSNNMPQMMDGGKTTYTIFAGRKDATRMVMQLSHNRHIKEDSRHFGQFWQSLHVYDFKLIQPEEVAVLYATLDFTAGA